MDDLTGQTLDRYTITELLGRGGMATVYRARQPRLERDVAVKVMLPSLSADAAFRERFAREAQTIANLRHPHILTIHDYGETADGLLYLVVEYVRGGTLHERLEQPLPWREAAEIAAQVAEALDYAHRQGVIHRDVKPSNILLTEAGHSLLADFGLVRPLRGDRRLTPSGVLMGTPDYMAPERAQGLDIDGRSDIYALGVALFEMLTGQRPYAGETPLSVILKHISEPAPRPGEFHPGIPPELDDIVNRAMAKSPDERYQRAGDMARALRAVLRSAADLAPTTGDFARLETPWEGVTLPGWIQTPVPGWTKTDAPFVGRQAEMQTLQAVWDEAQTGSAQMALLRGEAGVGKTRLAQSFLAQQASRGTRWIASRAFEGDQNTPYFSLVEALRPPVKQGIIPDIPVEALVEVACLLPELAASRPSLPPSREIEPEQAHARRRWAWATLIAGLCRQMPLILYLDDLQWTDGATLDCIQYLLTRNLDAPLLVVGALRTGDPRAEEPMREFCTNLRRSGLLTELSLIPFRPEETHQLVCASSGMAEAPIFSRRLHEHTDGNPFFILETIQALFDEGVLFVDRNGDWATDYDEVTESYAELPIPDSVGDVIRLRLRGLEGPVCGFLDAMAVFGREFDPDLLRQVVGWDQDRADEAVDKLVARQLIREEEDTCDFTHGIIRDTVYRDISPRRRRRLHRSIGAALEGAVGEMPSASDIQQLAHHFHQGELWEQALAYHLRAGTMALELFETQAARSYLEIAREIAETELKSVPDGQRLAYLEGLGDVYSNLGLYDLALSHHQSALDLVGEDAGRTADLCRKIATVLQFQSRFEEATRWLDQGLAALDGEAGDVVFSRICIQYGIINVRQGNLAKAFEWATKALDFESAQAHNLMGVIRRAQGDLDEALSHCERSIELAEGSQDLVNLAKAYSNVGVVLFEMDRWVDARHADERALELASAIDDAYMYAATLCNLSDLHRHLGSLDQAIAHARAGLERYRDLDSYFGQAQAHLNWGAALLEAGEPHRARIDHLDVARRLLQEQQIKEFRSEVERRIAESFLREGLLEQAESAANRALEMAFEQDSPQNLGSAQRLLGCVYRAQGRLAEAEKLITESVAVLGRHGPRYELGRAYTALATIHGSTEGGNAEAERALGRARSIFGDLGAERDLREVETLGSSFGVESTA